jgi:hypothetical protein
MLNATTYNFGLTIGYSTANYPVDDLAWIQFQIVCNEQCR